MTTRTHELVLHILEDAIVVDVDWSVWSKSVGLLVIADHMPCVDNKRPLYEVHCQRVREWHFEDMCGGADGDRAPDVQARVEERRHHMPEMYQWSINGAEVKRTGAGVVLDINGYSGFRGDPFFPRLTVVCRTVEVTRMSWSIPEAIWGAAMREPQSGMLRPSLRDCVRLVRQARPKGGGGEKY